jgi:hypothetical protein
MGGSVPAKTERRGIQTRLMESFTIATLPARFEHVVLSLDNAFKAGTSNDYSVPSDVEVGHLTSSTMVEAAPTC